MSILPRWFAKKERQSSAADTAAQDAVSAARQQASKLVDLANVAEDGGDLASALLRVREAIEIDPRYPRAHLNLGNVLLAGGDLEGASGWLREGAKALSPPGRR